MQSANHSKKLGHGGGEIRRSPLDFSMRLGMALPCRPERSAAAVVVRWGWRVSGNGATVGVVPSWY